MVHVLADERLYVFTGGEPPLLADLEAAYRFQIAGPDRDGETWHNWIIRLAGSDEAAGFVQTTVTDEESDIAWVVGVTWQGQGIATEAARAMCEWLVADGTRRLVAHIHPDHPASGKVAAALGLEPTEEIDSDGEVVWERVIDAGAPTS